MQHVPSVHNFWDRRAAYWQDARRPTPPRTPPPQRRPAPKRGHQTFGYVRSQRGPVPHRSTSDWFAEPYVNKYDRKVSGYEQSAALAFDAFMPGAILAAKARQTAAV